MSKVSGLDLGRDEFSIPANRIVGQDGAVTIPRTLSVNEKSVAVIIREVQAGSTSFLKKMDKIENLITSVQVDNDTDTVMLDKAFITQLTKLIGQAKNDFNKIVNADAN